MFMVTLTSLVFKSVTLHYVCLSEAWKRGNSLDFSKVCRSSPVSRFGQSYIWCSSSHAAYRSMDRFVSAVLQLAIGDPLKMAFCHEHACDPRTAWCLMYASILWTLSSYSKSHSVRLAESNTCSWLLIGVLCDNFRLCFLYFGSWLLDWNTRLWEAKIWNNMSGTSEAHILANSELWSFFSCLLGGWRQLCSFHVFINLICPCVSCNC